MATRSAIAVRTPLGIITAVYCHWDGYPENNGRILAEHYTTVDKITELMTLGSLSSLRPEIGERHPFSQFELKEGEVYEEAVYENWCTFYGRDRGETGTEARTFQDARDLVENFGMGVEYYYLWNGTEWLVNAHGRTGSWDFPLFDRVEDVLENCEE